MNIREYIKNNVLIFDGAMGTMLQSQGLERGNIPEELNFTNSEAIINIHKQYIEAGSKVISANTFGANEIKLEKSIYSVEEMIDKAIDNAKKAREDRADVYIALDIGPLGQLMEPLGTLKFERAYEVFKRQVIQGEKSGADVILIETMTDLYEAKAAILAAKENSSLPVFCTMSFQQDGRTFTGVSPLSMIMTFEGLGVDALGANCSLGPKELEPILDEILKYSSIPVMIQPNAGLPKMVDGKTLYDVKAEDFAAFQKKLVEKGVRIVGGCCGTNQEFIREMSALMQDFKVKPIEDKGIAGVCSPSQAVILDGVKIVGERINPTGKKLIKEALVKGEMDHIIKEALWQIEAGAEILDINVGLPEINEEEIMVKLIKEIQTITDTPIQIDSTNPRVIEKALRAYNGKAIVNSVTGDEKVLEAILPLVKKYGAAVVGLTLDEKGIPERAEERVKIAEKIIEKALSYGIKKEDVYIDCLTLTAVTNQKNTGETLKAITLVKEKYGVKTLLGVSNISYGLPNRSSLNSTFLAMALSAGLDLAIIDPLDEGVINTINAYKVLANEDIDGKEYIEKYNSSKDSQKTQKTIQRDLSLKDIIVKGLKEDAEEATKELLKVKSGMEIIQEDLIPTLDRVGESFDKGLIFLPQMIQSAETVKRAFEFIKKEMGEENKGESIYKGSIIMATVKGDVHDIGKNIVRMILENYGYKVMDLGKDVAPETIVEEAKKHNIKLVGLSALMTTTVKSMEDTIRLLRENQVECKVMVGGAVLNKQYADMIKADYYAKDPKEAVEIARALFG